MKSLDQITYRLDCANQALAESIDKKLKLFGLIKTNQLPHYFVVVIDHSFPDPQITQKLTEYYLQARENEQVKLAVVINSNFQVETEFVNRIDTLLKQLGSNNPIHRLFITQDLYTNDNVPPISAFEIYLSQAITNQTIQVSSKGNNLFFPTYLESFINLLVRSLFLYQSSGKTFHYVGQKITDLNLAYLVKASLQNLGGNLDINASGPNLSPPLPQIEKLSIDTLIFLNQVKQQDIDDYQLLTNRLKNISHPAPKTTNLVPDPEKRFKLNYERNILTYVFTILVGIVIISILPLTVFAIFLNRSIQSTTQSLNYLKQGNISKVPSSLSISRSYYQKSLPLYQLSSREIGWVFPKFYHELDNLLLIVKTSNSVIDSANSTYNLSTQAISALMGFNDNSQSTVSDIVLAIKTNLVSLNEDLSQLRLLINKLSLPLGLNSQLISKNIPDQIDKIQNQANLGLSLIDKFTPIITDTGSPFHILILLQNPNQLKPSGGEINKVVVGTIQYQRLNQIKLLDPLEITSQIHGKIAPPDFINQITGKDNLSFSDLNYSIDFSQTAEKISWYLSKANFTKPDLVLSITDSKDKSYLSQPQNLIDQLQSNNLDILSLARNVLDTLSNGDLQAYYTNPIYEKSLYNSSVSGIVALGGCHSQIPKNSPCISQVLNLNEGNYTASPLNSSIDRSVNHEIELTDTLALHTITVKYHYKEPTPNLNRPYQGLYQFALPTNSSLEKIELDGQNSSPISQSKEPFNGLDLYRLYLPTPLNQDHELKFQFKTNLDRHLMPGSAYSINLIKQPGTGSNYTLKIKFPKPLTPRAFTSKATVSDGQVLFAPKVFNTQAFAVQF